MDNDTNRQTNIISRCNVDWSCMEMISQEAKTTNKEILKTCR